MHRKFQKLLIVVTVNMERIPSDMERNFYFAFYIHLYCFICYEQYANLHCVHYKTISKIVHNA